MPLETVKGNLRKMGKLRAFFEGSDGNFVRGEGTEFLNHGIRGKGKWDLVGNVELRGFLRIWRWDGGGRAVKCRLRRFPVLGRNRTNIAAGKRSRS